MSFTELADGTRIRYTVRGNGPDLVLVHGWKQSHRLFDQAINRLSAEFRVHAFDQRGTGESDKPECSYDFSLLGADLLSILDLHSVQSATVVGWSMGCTTVLSAASQDTSRIGRIVLMNGPLRLLSTPDFPFGLSDEKLSEYIVGLSENWPTNQSSFLAESLLPKNHAMLPLLEYAAWQTPLAIALDLVRNQGLVDHRDTVRNLKVPVLAAYSQQDPYWPVELGDWIASNALMGGLHVFTDSAHCPPLEEPAEFSRVISQFSRSESHA
jgi:pimeloyl-ACP methyl ester carboxylesterase